MITKALTVRMSKIPESLQARNLSKSDNATNTVRVLFSHKTLDYYSLYSEQSMVITTLRKKHFQNIVGKEENVGNHFKAVRTYSTFFIVCKLMGECNTILSAYTLYRHLE